MKILLYLILIGVTAYNLYLSSSSVRHGEVNFFNDVARDFLLLDELDQKKIVLIGPRSNTNGLFHGPLWTYINYPAYLIGNGNPITVAWYWLFLACMFLLTSFFMVRKLFGTLAAFAFLVLTSIRLPFHINGLFHAESNFFFTPVFFFTIAMYTKTKKSLYLLLHILTLAILIQLNVGVGMQFLILSALFIVWFIYESTHDLAVGVSRDRNKLWRHLYAFLLLPLFLSNFILFDMRHGFGMARALISTGGSSQFFITVQSWIENRINNTISLQLSEQNSGNDMLSYLIFVFVITFTILQIKQKSKHREFYLLFLFYYFGYMVTSFFNKGILLVHYVFLLIPLTTLWFVSFLGSKYKLVFFPLIALVFFLNFNYIRGQIAAQGSFPGTSLNSWKGLSTVASEIVKEEEGREFGYFVYAPDAYAYQPRYAMLYNFKAAHAKAFEYTKKPTTYIIAAPPPPDNPYMHHEWWIKNEANIEASPSAVEKFPNGFTVEKFSLTEVAQKVPFDPNIELGIHFR